MKYRKEIYNKTIRYVDLFCGIGGFRIAIEEVSQNLGVPVKCVFSSDIDEECQKAYRENFGETPLGDITTINTKSIPKHELLLAGFPCQPFSIIGNRKGFEDMRGTLFFDIVRIIESKKPVAIVLENVKLLKGHNNGKTLDRIIQVLDKLEYHTNVKVLNALDFGLPQKRERIFIVGFRKPSSFNWPKGGYQMKPLKEILEKNVPEKYYASEYIRKNRLQKHKPTKEITIWHENKAGHISAYKYSCALRAGASYNYLLVNGERRLTPREMLRLQGFPEYFKIVCNYSQSRKQAGNSLPVPVAKEVIKNVFISNGWINGNIKSHLEHYHVVDGQALLFEERSQYEKKSKIKNRRKVQTALSDKQISK